MARSGQIRGRVNDEQLLSLLDQVAQAEERGSSNGGSGKSKITVGGEFKRIYGIDNLSPLYSILS